MRTIIGVFPNQSYAEEAILMLKDQGFQADDISIMMKDKAIGTEIEQKTGAQAITQGAASGATTGAVVGGLTGLFVGIGALTLPGIGAFVVGGPLAAALGLTGAAASTLTGATTGAVAGGLVGALMGLGLNRDEAKIYEQRLKEGALLVAIPTVESREGDVRNILSQFHASDMTSVEVPTDRIRAGSTKTMRDHEEYETSAHRHGQSSHAAMSMGMKGGRSEKKRI